MKSIEQQLFQYHPSSTYRCLISPCDTRPVYAEMHFVNNTNFDVVKWTGLYNFIHSSPQVERYSFQDLGEI